ncbi:hypothetical protein ART_1372 [Arthrobacter sp. PAMC 25486]|nr:hypothetical protein ART_1372 [Arthrobacter sp. PAMC 25486]
MFCGGDHILGRWNPRNHGEVPGRKPVKYFPGGTRQSREQPANPRLVALITFAS